MNFNSIIDHNTTHDFLCAVPRVLSPAPNPLAMQRSKEKRTRTSFTTFQLNELEREFKRNMYMFRQHRIAVAERLSLRESQIKIWFQNRRMRMKRETKLSLEKPTKETASTYCELKAQQEIAQRLMSHSEDTIKISKNYLRISKRTETLVKPARKILLRSSATSYSEHFAEAPDFAKILSYLQDTSSENLPYIMSNSPHAIYPYDLEMVLQSITTDLETSTQSMHCNKSNSLYHPYLN